MSGAIAVDRDPGARRSEAAILLGVILMEALMLAAGAALGSFAAAALAALAIAYFLVAFRFPDLAWALVWFTVPPNVEIVIPAGPATTVPTEPMIALALLAWILRSALSGRWRLRPSPLHLPLAALAGFALLSAAWSVRPVATLKAWVMLGGYAAFGYLYYFQSRCDRARRERWFLLIAITGLIWGVFGIVRVLTPGSAGPEAVAIASTYSFGAFRPFFREHGTYSAYLAMLLPAALLLTMERSGRERLLYGAAALAMAFGIVLAFARAGWLAILLVGPATAFVWARQRNRGRRLVWTAVVVAVVALVVGVSGIGRQVTKHAETAVSVENISNLERLNRWRAALMMARDRPLTGVGFGCYLDAYPTYRTKSIVTNQAFIRMGVHSEPLKLLSELGVPGLLIAMWFLGATFILGMRAFRKLPDSGDRVLALACVSGLATYVVNGCFNAYLVEDKVTVPFFAAIGVIAALGQRIGAGQGSGATGAGSEGAARGRSD